MLLTISTDRPPATDLGFLLHKHPAKVQSFELTFGTAWVYYSEASETRCTAALLLDVDPVGLVRGRGVKTLDQYVNDRPYVASSFLSVAMAKVFGTALSGRCTARPELAETAIPLTATISALPCPGGEESLRRLFEPLGYTVQAETAALDPQYPEWGESPAYAVTLSATLRLSALLSHLYVLLPTLDGEKHYYIGKDEVAKLLAKGDGWLQDHPEKAHITRRYLGRRGSLVRSALDQLIADEDPPEEAEEDDDEALEAPEPTTQPVHDQRLDAVAQVIAEAMPARVLDLGCGEGKLLRRLLDNRSIQSVVGMDVSHRSLEMAARKLKLERLPERQKERIELLHGSLIYRDRRLQGFDAAAVVEVIEHLDPPRLEAFGDILFGYTQPQLIVITTPNADYNVRFDGLSAGEFRHTDHRFEWSRVEFESWAQAMAERHGYTVRFEALCDVDPEVGGISQMGVFTR